MASGPWYISAAAVRQYLAIRRRTAEDGGPEWIRAEEELIAMAIRAAAQTPKQQANGLLQYRGPKPDKLNLVVSTTPRPEGPLPQLIAVIRPGR